MKNKDTYVRSCKISLKFITEKKRNKIKNLIKEYRRVVNLYIKTIWLEGGALNAKTLERISKTTLSQRYKSSALNQALSIVTSTKKALKATKKFSHKIPHFSGAPTLDAKFVAIENGQHSFDLNVRLSTLQKGKRIDLPCKKTEVLNKWLAKPTSRLIQGCKLFEDKIILFVEVKEENYKTTGVDLGIDLGVNKLITTSEGQFLGKDFKKIRDKISRKKSGSKSKQKAFAERENYFNKIINSLPWQRMKTLVVEDLTNLKKGKKKNRNKTFRKALMHWTYARLISRIRHKAQENRVRLVFVDPQNTSRTCPVCQNVNELNRNNEEFLCTNCGHRSDADLVGATNVLLRFQSGA